jgi:hypothetical protein
MRGFFFILILLTGGICQAQLVYPNITVLYDSACTFENLQLIPVVYKGVAGTGANTLNNTISLRAALKTGLVTVQERGSTAIENVHWLSLINNSDKNIYISSGEVMAGGRQDRMVTKDTLIKARSGRIDLPVMCVEEGRWSEKDKKFTYSKMANSQLRKVLDQTKSQVQVWREINNQLNLQNISSKTLAYLAREKDKKYLQRLAAYVNFFTTKFSLADSSYAGFIAVSGNTLIGSDIFISSNLFYNEFSSLLPGYIDEAISFGSSPQLSRQQIAAKVDEFLKTEAAQAEYIIKHGKQFKINQQVIHLTTY